MKTTLQTPENSSIKLFDHQIVAAESLLYHKKFLLADTMGAGKTMSAIFAAYNTGSKVLIVCPSSVKLNWKKELITFGIPKEDILVFKNTPDILKVERSKWVVINYDILNKLFIKSSMGRLIPGPWVREYRTVIFDEAHYCKSVTASGKPGSKRARFAIDIAKYTEYTFLLTGTPVPNHVCDLYNLMVMINADKDFASDWKMFAKLYCDAKEMSFRGRKVFDYSGAKNIDALRNTLAFHMLRRKTEEIVTLPKRINSEIPCDVSLAEYNRKVKECLQGYKQEGFNPLLQFTAMRQTIANSKTKNTISFAKNIVDAGKSVVVFTDYTSVLQDIVKAFEDKATYIDGSVSTTGRQKAIDEFQNGTKKVIVCNITAAGVGITLTRANVLIFNDYDWVPANMEQAACRIYRIGQTHTCNIIYMYASGCKIDEDLKDRLNKKLNYIGKIVDGEAANLLSTGASSYNDSESDASKYFMSFLRSIDG